MNKTRRNSFKKSKRKSVSIRQLYQQPLPRAITDRITPLMLIGGIGLILTIGTAIIRTTRGTSPFLAVLTFALLGYATWLRYDVISQGYAEILFKVIDYTYLTRLSRRPTGMLLVKHHPGDTDDLGNYHIALSGKEDVPPIGWVIKAYVPEGAVPAEYSGRKYFPTVFGYSLIGEEDHDNQYDL